jgi:hypothetical protein
VGVKCIFLPSNEGQIPTRKWKMESKFDKTTAIVDRVSQNHSIGDFSQKIQTFDAS